MPIPSPQERPDLYDDYDGRRDAPKPGEKEYWDSVAPDHIKEMLAAKAGAQNHADQDAAAEGKDEPENA